MRQIINQLFFAFLFLFLHLSCKKTESIFDVCHEIEIIDQHLILGDTLYIHFNYETEFVTVYPGDSGHVYGVPDNIGIPVYLNEFSYQYKDTGIYTITIYNADYILERGSSEICTIETEIEVN